jgi:hypothetical protein
MSKINKIHKPNSAYSIGKASFSKAVVSQLIVNNKSHVTPAPAFKVKNNER